MKERDQMVRVRRSLHHDLKLLSVMKRTTLVDEAEAAIAKHLQSENKKLERVKGAA